MFEPTAIETAFLYRKCNSLPNKAQGDSAAVLFFFFKETGFYVSLERKLN